MKSTTYGLCPHTTNPLQIKSVCQKCMTTEEFYRKNLKDGTMLRRNSDGMIFEVVSAKDVKQYNGSSEMEYVLEAPSGSRLTSSGHWIDCYFSIASPSSK